jgi:lactoylglutathione lyase
MNTEIKSNVNVKQVIPFFMVVNMDKSLNFYINVLGFQLINKWEPHGKIEWCLLQLENASIMLQEYRQSPLNEKLGAGVTICFMCEDALTIHQQIILRGIEPSEPFVGNNLWVVELKDPDGYNILFESPTDVPEETLYSEWLKPNKT